MKYGLGGIHKLDRVARSKVGSIVPVVGPRFTRSILKLWQVLHEATGGENRRHVGERAVLGEARPSDFKGSARNRESSSPTALLGVALTAVLAFGPPFRPRTHARLHLHNILDLHLGDWTLVGWQSGFELHNSAAKARAFPPREVGPRAVQLLCGNEWILRPIRNGADGHRPGDKIFRFADLEAALHCEVVWVPRRHLYVPDGALKREWRSQRGPEGCEHGCEQAAGVPRSW